MASEWTEVRLGELGEVNRGRSRHRPRNAPFLYGGEYPFIQTGDIKAANGRVTRHTQTYSEAGLAQSRIWPAGTMAITIAANIAETAILTYPACFPDSVVGFIADDTKADVRFIEYLFRSLRQEIQSEYVGTGSVQDNINLQTLDRLILRVPQLAEQRHISATLGALDDRIDNLRATSATLEAIAQALFKSWFVDFDPVHAKAEGRAPAGMDAATAALFPSEFEDSELGPIPKDWRVSSVGNAFNVTMGQSPPGNTYNETGEGMAFYQGRTDFAFRFPSERVFCTAPTRLAKRGDVLVSVRAPVGDINVAMNDCAIGRGVAAVRSTYRSFALYAAKTLHPRFASFESEGTVFGSINKKQLHALPLVMPTDDLLLTFEATVGAMDSRIGVNEYQIRALCDIRDTLLPRLISGKLRLPDADAEVEVDGAVAEAAG